MLSGLKVLQSMKKIEIFALIIAWFYLFNSGLIVVVGSVAYILFMLDYWKVRSEPFPGLMILSCAISIGLAILVICISFDMIHGIKHKDHKDLKKFRFFIFLCLVASFILLPISLYELSAITKWLFGENYGMLKLPTIDIVLLILIYHIVIYMIVDVIYDDYKRNKPIEEKQDDPSISSLSENVDNIMLHVVEIH